MKVAIRYYSRNGKTKQLAYAIQEQLGVAAEPIDIPIPHQVELLFLGTSCYGAKVSQEMEDFIPTLKNRKMKVVYFSTAAFRKSYFEKLKKQLKQEKVQLLPESFFLAKFCNVFQSSPKERDLKNIKEFSRQVIQKYLLV